MAFFLNKQHSFGLKKDKSLKKEDCKKRGDKEKKSNYQSVAIIHGPRGSLRFSNVLFVFVVFVVVLCGWCWLGGNLKRLSKQKYEMMKAVELWVAFFVCKSVRIRSLILDGRDCWPGASWVTKRDDRKALHVHSEIHWNSRV